MKNVNSFPDHSWDRSFIDFETILAPSWEPKRSQHRYKRGLKNYEKMMMTRMANKSDTGGSGTIRHQGFEPRGGGRRGG